MAGVEDVGSQRAGLNEQIREARRLQQLSGVDPETRRQQIADVAKKFGWGPVGPDADALLAQKLKELRVTADGFGPARNAKGLIELRGETSAIPLRRHVALWNEVVPTLRPVDGALGQVVDEARNATGVDAVNAAAARVTQAAAQAPPVRGGLEHDPVIGPLLALDRPLTPQEHQRVVEAVLSRGTIVSAVPNDRQSTNPVYRITFAEKIGGQQLQAIAKPELGRRGVPTVGRTALSYVIARLLGLEHLIPASVESVFSVDDGKTYQWGSIMQLEPGAIAGDLGDEASLRQRLDTPEGRRDLAQAHLLLFLNDDLDHFNDRSGHYSTHNNMSNIILSPGAVPRLKLIDTEYSFGMPFAEVEKGMLPGSIDPQTLALLKTTSGAEIEALAHKYVPEAAAKAAGARWEAAKKHLLQELPAARQLVQARLQAEPAWNAHPTGEMYRLEDAFCQLIEGPGLRKGRALLVVNPKLHTSHMIEGTFLDLYVRDYAQYKMLGSWRESMFYGHSVVGPTPLEDPQQRPDTSRSQRFERGYLSWIPSTGVLAVRSLKDALQQAVAAHPGIALKGEPFPYRDGFAVPLEDGRLLFLDPKTDGSSLEPAPP